MIETEFPQWHGGAFIAVLDGAAEPRLRDAASAQRSHEFLIIGAMFMYVRWSYWVSRKKVRGCGYH
ncbi:hypothetical protein [Paraburkholderia sp. LEh10]|uniref:hypothetical protein n=1 Tax=Paraburkholderia sp. LEh10 TaxID=2821353 RepID=UPI003917D61A